MNIDDHNDIENIVRVVRAEHALCIEEAGEPPQLGDYRTAIGNWLRYGMVPQGDGFAFEITSLDDDRYRVVDPIVAIFRDRGGSVVASVPGANINASGENRDDAIRNVKDMILVAFDRLMGTDDNRLGPAVLPQKRFLERHVMVDS